jgi:hypothetical protein
MPVYMRVEGIAGDVTSVGYDRSIDTSRTGDGRDLLLGGDGADHLGGSDARGSAGGESIVSVPMDTPPAEQRLNAYGTGVAILLDGPSVPVASADIDVLRQDFGFGSFDLL